MMIRRKHTSPLRKKAQRGFRGYPVATLAFYGPDDTCANKVAVGIVQREDAEPAVLARWVSAAEDVRYSATIGAEILRFVQRQGVQSVAMVDRIIGCPHEEGTEYPEGQSCPRCPFWAHRERWSGEIRH
jgi:hypothetical protein